MNDIADIIIIKLGGSVLTDKSTPYSIREKNISHLLNQIKKSKKPCIIVHGAGSFGHPLAKEFHIKEGRNNKIPNQILAFAKLHESVTILNSHIIKNLHALDYPCFTLQPSAIFNILNEGKIQSNLTNLINLLDLGITPVLYGDIIFQKASTFSIISGDEIIYEICKYLTSSNQNKYRIQKIIFCTDIDGIYIEDSFKNSKIIEYLSYSDIESIKLAQIPNKIDVTGSIEGKLKEIKKISQFNIKVQILNGLKEDYLEFALKNQQILSTIIE